MEQLRELTPQLSVTSQITAEDIKELSAAGFSRIINNRPDGEAPDQPPSQDLEIVAREYGMDYVHIPVTANAITDKDIAAFGEHLNPCDGRVLAFCRTGNRSTRMWALSNSRNTNPEELIAKAAEVGYDIIPIKDRMMQAWQHEDGKKQSMPSTSADHDVVIVGGGAAGCATAASLLQRKPDLNIAIIEPHGEHYYQPGWTLVGAGVFKPEQAVRPMESCIPGGVSWIKSTVNGFDPDKNTVQLENGKSVSYKVLVVCPGLVLNWQAIEGCEETLGKNGVTSNYRVDLAPYTWELVRGLKGGRALFTQPPMPIKCAGAPQKAMYLSCDWWQKQGVLDVIQVDFCTATPGLFGVTEFVPPLMKYVKRYGAELHFKTTLKAVDGQAKKAWFTQIGEDGKSTEVEKSFDMLHVVPPQKSPECISQSALANTDGWVDVDSETLAHTRYSNVFGLGDAAGSPNAKTAAAVRKQAPIVAQNVLAELEGRSLTANYDGYGACPLTVERGKVILAEFSYGGKLQPTLPLDPTVPRRLNWQLKARAMPWIYFDLMLKGREWFL